MAAFFLLVGWLVGCSLKRGRDFFYTATFGVRFVGSELVQLGIFLAMGNVSPPWFWQGTSWNGEGWGGNCFFPFKKKKRQRISNTELFLMTFLRGMAVFFFFWGGGWWV